MKALIIILALITSLSYASYAQQSPCDYKVEILLNKTEFTKEEFKWRMKATKIEGGSTNLTGTAEILDSSKKTIKSYKPWTNEQISRQKTSSEYSPNLNYGEYRIISKIKVECDDANNDNNIDIKTIKITFEINEESKDSLKETKHMEVFDAKIDVTETKNEVPSIINNTKSETTILQNNKTENLEKNELVDNEIIPAANKTEINNEKITANAIKENIVYESSNEKAKNLIVIFLLALSILLNIILIWKR